MKCAHLLPKRREGKIKVHLLFTVLKLLAPSHETSSEVAKHCNSTYRLRYAPQSERQQRSKVTMRSALLLPERRESKMKVIR